MKLSEAVEIMEQNHAIKERVIEKCIEEIGDKVQTKFVVWNDYELTQKSIPNKFEFISKMNEDLFQDIIKDAGLKEYNDNIIAMQILEGYKVYETTKELNIRMDKYRSIKSKIYESIKKREQDKG